jgi:hypothetical protein
LTTVIDPIVREDTKLFSSEPGRVVVAKGKRGYRTFLDDKGPTLGERMFGGFDKYYLVDVSEKEVTDTFDAASKKGALPFKLTIEYHITIERTSADKIVQDAIRDLSKVFRDTLHRHLNAAARQCDINDLNAARAKLEEALENFKSTDERFKFRAGIVEVALDEDTTKKVRTIDSEELDKARGSAAARVADQEIERQRLLLQSGEKLLAAYQATGEQKYRDALEFIVAKSDRSRAERRDLLRQLIDAKIAEGMDFPAEVVQNLFGSVVSDLDLGHQQLKAIDVEAKSIDVEAKTVDSKPSSTGS